MGYEQGLKALLEMSCTGALVILVVLAARLLLRRGPRLYAYMLWAVVLFRLLCPVSVPSQVSIMNLVPTAQSVAVTPLPEAAVQTQNQAQTQRPPQTQVTTQTQLPPDPVTPAEKGINRWQWAGGIWLTGALALAAGCMIHTLLWKRRLAEAVVLRDNIYLCDWVQTPFVLGIFRPKIYLPSALKEEEMTHIILHEQCHIRRGDHWIRALSLLALCLHWFNPLVWVAFFLSEKDMEMSCDEAVLKKLGAGICREYADSLLRLAGRNVVSVGLPLTFGKGGLKMRIKNIVGWKEPKWYVAAVCLLLCAVVLVGCGLNAVASRREDEGMDTPLEEMTLITPPEESSDEDDIVFLTVPQRVGYDHGDVHMSVSLPAGWGYQIVEYYSDEYRYGILFYPPERPDCQVCLLANPMGFVPGSRFIRETATMDNGAQVEWGYRFKHHIWEYIWFTDVEEQAYTLTCTTTNQWWDTYEEEAREIINSIEVGNYPPDYPYDLGCVNVDLLASDADLTALEEENARYNAAAEAASAADLKVDEYFTADAPGVYIPDWEETYLGPWEEDLFYAYGFADMYGNFAYIAPGYDIEESYDIANAYIKYVEFGGPDQYSEIWDDERLARAYEKYYPAMDFAGFLKAYTESGKSLEEFTNDVYSWVNTDWLAGGQG